MNITRCSIAIAVHYEPYVPCSRCSFSALCFSLSLSFILVYTFGNTSPMPFFPASCVVRAACVLDWTSWSQSSTNRIEMRSSDNTHRGMPLLR